jgi:DNA-binding response OmpR family regulator
MRGEEPVSKSNTVNGSQTGRPTVLLVEDDVAAGRGLARLLTASGFHVDHAVDGTSALRTFAAERPPDFLLTDLRLPDIDGREVARAATRLTPRPRIALITGWDLERSEIEKPEWGIDWFFKKPIDVQELIRRLKSTITEKSERDPTDSAGPSGTT